MEDILHINALSLYVADISRSEAFYRRIFQADITRVNEKNIVVDMGNLLLNLLDMSLSYQETSAARGPLPMEISIWVVSVDLVYEELMKRGAAFLAPPRDQPWGMRNAAFFDPDGHRFEIASKIEEPQHRGAAQ
ncbi:MAG: VOC family protein [Eubacteriales bacterium]|nr:VOC family protein [Eubacteriales bacterium]